MTWSFTPSSVLIFLGFQIYTITGGQKQNFRFPIDFAGYRYSTAAANAQFEPSQNTSYCISLCFYSIPQYFTAFTRRLPCTGRLATGDAYCWMLICKQIIKIAIQWYIIFALMSYIARVKCMRLLQRVSTHNTCHRDSLNGHLTELWRNA